MDDNIDSRLAGMLSHMDGEQGFRVALLPQQLELAKAVDASGSHKIWLFTAA